MFKLLGKIFQRHDYLILLSILLLLSMSSVLLYSTTYESGSFYSPLIAKQLLLMLIGITFYIVLSISNISIFRDKRVLILAYITTIGLLAYTLYFAPVIASTQRWITIGPITVQPAEYAKITIILISASILGGCSKNHKLNFIQSKQNSIQKILSIHYVKIILSMLAILPILVLILLQPSLGNTLITLSIWGGIVLISFPNKFKLALMLAVFVLGILLSAYVFSLLPTLSIVIFGPLILGLLFVPKYYKQVHILEIVLTGVLAFCIIPSITYSWNNTLKDYQKGRIESFLNPEKDPLGSGWQVRQSKIAVGSGRVFGRGLLRGTQSSLDILPFAYTDFAFAAIAEQTGFIGSIATLAILFFLVLKVFSYKDTTPDEFSQNITTGVGLLLLTNIVVNVGMNLGVLPVTGVPLPFLSYGGSAIIVNLIALGLIQSLHKTKKESYNFESFSI